MIVKNEEHVIKETLANILSYIPLSYYVISDTGSTDNTVKVIKDFFDSKKIKGEIYNDEWKNFGYNRTLALKYAYKKSKYILIFDADDKIVGKFSMLKNLTLDAYHFKFGTGVTYKRLLLVNNQLKWEFIGLLHEYIMCIDNRNFTTGFIDGDYYVDSGKSGNRSKDPQKYYKDALLLEKGYEEAEKENSHLKIRYAFYCAQSYRDCGMKEKSIEWYKKRVDLKDWDQEVYFSYFMIGRQYNELGEDEKAFYYWSLAIEADKERYEAIYEIITYLRKKNLLSLAYQYYLMIPSFKINLNDKLFVHYDVYEYLLDYEMIFIFFYNKKFKEGVENIKKLLYIYKSIPIYIRINIIECIVFYLEHINFDLVLQESYMNFIQDTYRITKSFHDIHIDKIVHTVNKFTSLYDKFDYKNVICNKIKYDHNNNGNSKKIKVFLSITSCKRYDLFTKTIDSIMVCFKDIELIDYFFCVDDNSSKEDRTNMLKKYPFLKYYFKKEDEKGHLKSMNIIHDKLRELKPKYWIHLEDDWLFIKPFNYVKTCMDFLENNREDNIHQILFNKNYGETLDCYNLVGGTKLISNDKKDENDYLLHIKDEPDLKGRNCSYWPHYSFRPSMTLVSTILELGNYDSPNTFFEMDYANKYYAKGYKSAFFNEIMCLHTGRLTSERNNIEKQNAYDLNNVSQFGSKQKEENSIFIYLDKNKIEFETIKNYYIIQRLFKGSYFKNNNKNKILNVLNHLNLWLKIRNVEHIDKIFIFNYEISEINKNIISKIINESKDKDIIFIKNKFNSENELWHDNDNIQLNKIMNNEGNDNMFEKDINLHGYIITKQFINKFFDYVKTNYITDNLLNTIFKIDNINIYTTEEVIVDFQKDKMFILDELNDLDDLDNKLNFVINDDLDNVDNNDCDNYIFIKGKDHYGDDLFFNGKKNIDEMKYICDLHEEIIGFNNLGYYKNVVNIDKMININFGNEGEDGFYINVKKYKNKYGDLPEEYKACA
jgi:hypothetical protein